MWKKFISYLIIFSILYSDVASCGGIISLFSEDADNPTHSTRRTHRADISPLVDPTQELGEWEVVSTNDSSGSSLQTCSSTVTSSDSPPKSPLSTPQINDDIPTELNINFEVYATREIQNSQFSNKLSQHNNGSLDEFSDDESPDTSDDRAEKKENSPLKGSRNISSYTQIKTDTEIFLSQDQNVSIGYVSPLSEPARATLTHLKKRLLDGNYAWNEWMTMGVGAGIGAGTAYAMGILYIGGTDFLLEYEELFPYISNGPSYFYYTFGMTLLDAVPRNIDLWYSGLSYLSERGANMGAVVLNGAASSLPALIAPFALITIAKYTIGEEGTLFHNELATEAICFATVLFFDGMAFSMDMLKKMWGSVQKRLEKSALRSCFGRPSLDEILTRKFHDILEGGKRTIGTITDEDVKEQYYTLLNIKDTIVGSGIIDRNNVEAAQAFLSYNYLIDFFSKNHPKAHIEDLEKCETEEIAPHVRSWYDTVTDFINYTSLTLGSPMRLMVLQFIVNDILESIVNAFSKLVIGHHASEETEAILWTASWVIAAVVGFPVQTAFEYKGMKNFTHDFLYHEEPYGHTTRPWVRGFAKFISAVHGLLLTLPIAVLALQVCDKNFHPNWLENPGLDDYRNLIFTTITAFLLPEWAVQTTIFEDSFNRKIVTGLSDFHQYIRGKIWQLEPSVDYMRDYLIRFIEKQQDGLKHLHRQVLEKLDEVQDYS